MRSISAADVSTGSTGLNCSNCRDMISRLLGGRVDGGGESRTFLRLGGGCRSSTNTFPHELSFVLSSPAAEELHLALHLCRVG